MKFVFPNNLTTIFTYSEIYELGKKLGFKHASLHLIKYDIPEGQLSTVEEQYVTGYFDGYDEFNELNF